MNLMLSDILDNLPEIGTSIVLKFNYKECYDINLIIESMVLYPMELEEI